MPNELKPCPFCGGEAKLTTFRSARVRLFKLVGYSVDCSVCCARSVLRLEADEAIEAWNRRVENG